MLFWTFWNEKDLTEQIKEGSTYNSEGLSPNFLPVKRNSKRLSSHVWFLPLALMKGWFTKKYLHLTSVHKHSIMLACLTECMWFNNTGYWTGSCIRFQVSKLVLVWFCEILKAAVLCYDCLDPHSDLVLRIIYLSLMCQKSTPCRLHNSVFVFNVKAW